MGEQPRCIYILWDTTCRYMYMYVCAIKGGSTDPVMWELHMHGELPKEYCSFTQRVHMHKSVRVTVRTCSHILLCEIRDQTLCKWYKS